MARRGWKKDRRVVTLRLWYAVLCLNNLLYFKVHEWIMVFQGSKVEIFDWSRGLKSKKFSYGDSDCSNPEGVLFPLSDAFLTFQVRTCLTRSNFVNISTSLTYLRPMEHYFLSFRFVIILILLLQEFDLRVIPESTAKAILPLSDKWK